MVKVLQFKRILTKSFFSQPPIPALKFNELYISYHNSSCFSLFTPFQWNPPNRHRMKWNVCMFNTNLTWWCASQHGLDSIWFGFCILLWFSRISKWWKWKKSISNWPSRNDGFVKKKKSIREIDWKCAHFTLFIDDQTLLTSTMMDKQMCWSNIGYNAKNIPRPADTMMSDGLG